MDSKRWTWILSGLFFFTLALFVYSCFQRPIHVDDAWLGETALWLAKEGVIRSEALRGWQNAEDHVFFTHKLFILLGAFFISMFGVSVHVLKSISAVYLGLTLASSIFILKRMQFSKNFILVFLSLFLANALVFEFSFIYRPELALCFYSLWIYWFLSHRIAFGPALIAGALGALAIGHHLNGVIIVGAGCVLLLWQKRWLHFFAFGVVAAFGFLFHFYDIKSIEDFNLMLSQFSNTQDMRESGTVWAYAYKLFEEQKRYFHSPKEITLTLLFWASFFLAQKTLLTKYKSVLVYVAALAIFLALISHGATSKYLIFLLPFMVFICAIGISEMQKSNKYKAALLIFLTLAYYIVNLQVDFKTATRKDNLAQLLEAAGGDILPGTFIMAPMEASFWAWDRYRMQSVQVYQIYNWDAQTLEGQTKIWQLVEKVGIQEMLLFSEHMKRLGIDGPKWGPFDLKIVEKAGVYRVSLQK